MSNGTLNVDFINPFVTGTFSVLSMVLGETPERGQLGVEPAGSTSNPVNVVVGITGEAHGHIILGMSLVTADKIASAMIGQPVITFDAMAASAISELGNMICGNALSALAQSGRICDITPPTIIKGEKVQISSIEIPAIVMPMKLTHGQISLTIALKSRSAQNRAA